MKKLLILLLFIPLMSFGQAADDYLFSGLDKLYDSNDYRGAILDFNRAIELDLDSTYYDLSHKHKSYSTMKLAIELREKKVSLNYLDKEKEKEAQEEIDSLFKEALFIINKSIKINSTRSESFLTRADLKFELKDFNGAIADYYRTIEVEPDFPSQVEYCYTRIGIILLKNGISLLQKGDLISDFKFYNEAILYFNKAIETSPDSWEAYNNRAVAKVKLKDFNGALLDYNKSIELNSNCFDCYSGRGTVKKVLKDFNGALLDYNKSIELNSNYAMAYWNRGLLKYYDIDDKKGACQDARKAESLGYDSSGYDAIYREDYAYELINNACN